jgi:gluconate 2-dehydrogenase gamma chain
LFVNARRNFLKSSFLSIGVLVSLRSTLFGAVSPLETLSLVHEDLFPFAKELGVNTPAYLSIILNHSRILDEDKLFLRNGVQWLHEEALREYQTLYTQLSSSKRQELLHLISQQNWGKRWLHLILSYTMEAIFSDKIYGVNPQNAGQKWLGHRAGFPSPKEALR